MSDQTDGGTPGGTATADPDDTDVADAPVSVTGTEKYRNPTPYEIRLRAENQKWRQRARDAEQAARDAKGGNDATAATKIAELEQKVADARTTAEQAAAQAKLDAEQAVQAAKTEADQSATEARTAAERRIIRSEVRAAAVAQGMQHLKGLDMLDLTEVKLDDKGDLMLPDGYWDKAKTDLPFLFAAPKDPARTTSSTSTTPAAAPTGAKKATEMTAEEYKVARAALHAGRAPA